MAAHEAPARTVNAGDVTPAWSDALAAVEQRGERVAVQKDGVTVAAIISSEDLERLSRIDDRREGFFAALERVGAALADEDPEESERLAALAVAEVREEMRRERTASSEV